MSKPFLGHTPHATRFCHVSGEQCFDSQNGAKKCAKSIAARQRNVKLRTYLCPHCHSHHLTSRDEFMAPPTKKPRPDLIREQLQEWQQGAL